MHPDSGKEAGDLSAAVRTCRGDGPCHGLQTAVALGPVIFDVRGDVQVSR